jgi:hypothetical protein
MAWYDIAGDQSWDQFSVPPLRDGMLHSGNVRRQRGAGQHAAGPKGAPPTIPPIIINPFRYQVPGPAIDPRSPPPSPPIMPPSRPAMS